MNEPLPEREIGRAGTVARVVVGCLLLGIVLQGELSTHGLSPRSLVTGLLVIPAAVLLLQWLRARRSPARLVATSPWAFALNLAVIAALYLTPWYAPPLGFTSDAMLYFYGGSMLIAAWRGQGGCEVLALSNWLLRRDDQVGCAIFLPVDYLERRRAAIS